MIDALYSREILRRTTQLLHIGHLEHPQASADKVSRLCGSSVHVEICVLDGVITQFAQQVEACALGQAAAAILSQHIIGAPVGDVFAARDALKLLLKGELVIFPERFQDLEILSNVKDYPARHTSTLLALEAVGAAISSLNRS